MKGRKRLYNLSHLVSAVFMILALAWLTVSAPFVTACQQEFCKQFSIADNGGPMTGSEEETANPFGNTTEEKKPSGSNSFSEEYLHDHHAVDHFFSLIYSSHQSENSGLYTAFHGEVHVPPPNLA